MTTTNTISNGDDIIDSRDVIARIEELEGYRDDAQEGKPEIPSDQTEPRASVALNGSADPCASCGVAGGMEHADECEGGTHDLESQFQITNGEIYWQSIGWDEDEAEELRVLLALQEEAEGSADWTHGETLIRDSYFEDYARELAEDIGAVPKDRWPCSHIDWEAAADDLKQDYMSVDFDGVEYWIRG